MEEALFLTRLVKKVHIIHRRDQLRAIKILQERALAHDKIAFIWNTVVDKIEGDNSVESLKLKNIKDDRALSLNVEGVFIYVGLSPNTSWLKSTLPLTEQGFIETNDAMETSLPGVFAAGDVRHKLLRQIATAVGDGSTAAFAAEKYLDCTIISQPGDFLMETKDLRNIALISHGGAGKTSLADAFLFNAKVNTRLGMVDEGTSLFDFEPEELKRKKTLSSSLHHFKWQKCNFNLIDTPGGCKLLSGCTKLPAGG